MITSRSNMTLTSPVLVSTGDGWCVVRDTAVDGYVQGSGVSDISIGVSEGRQCGAVSCGGWGLVLDIDNIVSTH